MSVFTFKFFFFLTFKFLNIFVVGVLKSFLVNFDICVIPGSISIASTPWTYGEDTSMIQLRFKILNRNQSTNKLSWDLQNLS